MIISNLTVILKLYHSWENTRKTLEEQLAFPTYNIVLYASTLSPLFSFLFFFFVYIYIYICTLTN
jgi:hypothetical protein